MTLYGFVSGRRAYRTTVLLLGLLALAAAPAAAQGEASGTIIGVITDAQGGVLPGVSVTLRNVDTGAVRTAVTEGDGAYRLPGLLPGRYDLTAELAGFNNAQAMGVTLTIGLEQRRDLTMGLGGLLETLTVTGEAPIVETTTTEVSSVVTQEQIALLPIADRSPGMLALLLPGTSLPTRTRRARPEIGAGGAHWNLSGSYIDGGNNILYTTGGEFLEAPQSGLREFKVNMNGASAQYGAVGGIVLTATKSGTNRFTGELFEHFRDTSLNAFDKLEKARHDKFGDPKPEYRRNQYGGAVGGPILQDRLHFFTAFEATKEPKSVTVDTRQPQFYSAVEGNFPAGYERRQFMGRVDFQINEKHSAFGRYLYDKEFTFCESCGGNSSGFSGTDTSSPRDSLLLAHTWVVSPRILNEIRSQVPPTHLENLGAPPGLEKWPRSGYGQFPLERYEGYTNVYNFPSLSWGSNGGSSNNTARWDIYNDLTMSVGDHTLKFGAAYLQFRSEEEDGGPPHLGTWTFDTDQFFDGSAAAIANLRNPIQFTASFPPLKRPLRADWIQGYVHDEWRPLSNLTVDIGLRYENQYKSFNNDIDLSDRPRLKELIDPTTRKDTNNFGPRLGLAWNVRSDGGTVVRFLTGKYYTGSFVGGLRSEVNTLRRTSISIRNPPYPDPYGSRSPESFASTAPPNVAVVDDKIEQPEAWSYNVGLSRELMPNVAIHFDGIYSNVRKMNATTNINTPDPITGLRPLPTWGIISQFRAVGGHDYRALYVRLDKRLANRYQYLVSYTLAKEENLAPTGAVTDFYNPELDRGPGTDERRHTLVASGGVRLPYDVTLGAVLSLRSSRPFSARAGQDLNRDGASGSDYVPGTTRNMGNRGQHDALLAAVNAWRARNGRAPIAADQLVTDEYKKVDVRLSKAFSLRAARQVELALQVFNLLGMDNLGGAGQGYVENALSNSFGTINSVQPRQQAELMVRFIW